MGEREAGADEIGEFTAEETENAEKSTENTKSS